MPADGVPQLNKNQIKPKSGRGGPRAGAGRKPGKLSKDKIEARDLAQKYGPDAIRKAAEMAGLIKEGGQLVGQAASEAVRVSALNIIIERAYGKAPQPLNHGDNEGGKLQPAIFVGIEPPPAPQAGPRALNGSH